MNGAPLPADHGAPVRLIAPGWYGVANVKWLTRIEVLDTRYAGRFMARDYVTHPRGAARRAGGLDVHLGRAGPAQVGAGQGDARRATGYRDHGAAWGAPIAAGRGADRRRAVAGGDARRGRSAASARLRLALWTLRLGDAGAGRAHGRVAGDRRRRATSSRRRTTRSSPPSRPTGRATARSPGGSASPQPEPATPPSREARTRPGAVRRQGAHRGQRKACRLPQWATRRPIFAAC